MNFDWDSVKTRDVNLYAQNFMNALNLVYQQSFPLKTKLVTYKFFKNPWYTNDVQKLTKARNCYQKLLKAELITTAEYSLFRNKITSLIRKCKETFYECAFNRNISNIRKTWKLINKICDRKPHTSIEKIIHNQNTIENPLLIAETFNNFEF